MAKLTSVEQVKSELKKAGINIVCSRRISDNSFHLVSPSFGHYLVNADANTTHEDVINFCKEWDNITISLNC